MLFRNQIRFDYTHEILRDEDSYIRDVKVNKGRRVSVMFRDQPVEDHSWYAGKWNTFGQITEEFTLQLVNVE